jgi:hypothetical protein
VSFFSSDKEGFVFSKDKDLLDATNDLFTWLDKETLGTGNKDFLTELVSTLFIERVEDVTELIFLKDGNVDLLDESFMDVNDVG